MLETPGRGKASDIEGYDQTAETALTQLVEKRTLTLVVGGKADLFWRKP